MTSSRVHIYPAVHVSNRGSDRLRLRHQWIFRSDLHERKTIPAGSVVRVLDGREKFLAWAFYSSSSQIALRLFDYDEIAPTREYWRKRLADAIGYRASIVENTEMFRVVSSEGDQLSSLIVDRYGPDLVLQTLSQGAEHLKPLFVELLQELLQPRAIVQRNDSRVRELEGLRLEKGVLAGEYPGPTEVAANGFRFRIDLLEGQKTGAFLDQRENHARAADFARGRALDCFCYQGGFALSLARRAQSVLAVDVSGAALELAKTNAQRNNLGNIGFCEANVFDFLKSEDERKARYDTIVLDPPAFAKNKQSVEKALGGYKEINLRALKLLNAGGTLITCSCSAHVSESLFLGILLQAAADAGRSVQLVERRTQAKDHPVALGVPESLYLKALILRAL